MADDDSGPQGERPALRVIPGGGRDSLAAMAARAKRGTVILTDTGTGKTAAAHGPRDLLAGLIDAGDWVDGFLEEGEWFREAVAKSDPWGG